MFQVLATICHFDQMLLVALTSFIWSMRVKDFLYLCFIMHFCTVVLSNVLYRVNKGTAR